MPIYNENDVVIISGVRTAVGKFQGSLAELSAVQLGAIAVREAVKRVQVDAKQVDECIMGNVVTAGLGQNPARQAALNGGLPPEVGAMTINKVCGSGLKAVALGAQAIQTGNSEIADLWYVLAIDAKYKTAYGAMEQFLSRVGRQKFLQPLYKELMTTGQQLLAKEWFGKYHQNYHPIAQQSVGKIIGK